MAFTTEFVAAAQSGPGVEVVTATVATTNTNTYSTSLELPPGVWMVVAKGRTSHSYAVSPGTIDIDGTRVFRMEGDGASVTPPTGMKDSVAGGRSITIATTYIRNRVFDLYAVRTA